MKKKIFILIGIVMMFACHNKKHEITGNTDSIPVTDSILQWSGNFYTPYASDTTPQYTIAMFNDTTGNIRVFNKRGDKIFEGNVNDTLKTPCKICKKKGISVCERYRRENLKLWKKLQSCEKGDYYTPSLPKPKEIPADTLPLINQ